MEQKQFVISKDLLKRIVMVLDHVVEFEEHNMDADDDGCLLCMAEKIQIELMEVRK